MRGLCARLLLARSRLPGRAESAVNQHSLLGLQVGSNKVARCFSNCRTGEYQLADHYRVGVRTSRAKSAPREVGTVLRAAINLRLGQYRAPKIEHLRNEK